MTDAAAVPEEDNPAGFVWVTNKATQASYVTTAADAEADDDLDVKSGESAYDRNGAFRRPEYPPVKESTTKKGSAK